MNNIESPAITVFGFLVAVTAVVGTQVLGWEWPDRNRAVLRSNGQKPLPLRP